MKLPTSSACSPKPKPNPAPLHSNGHQCGPRCPVGQHSLLTLRRPLFPPQPRQEAASLGVDLHRLSTLATIKTVCVCRLPSTTALYQWIFWGEKKGCCRDPIETGTQDLFQHIWELKPQDHNCVKPQDCFPLSRKVQQGV